MVAVEIFVGHPGKELHWAPGLGCQEVVHGQLGGSNDTKASRQVEII